MKRIIRTIMLLSLIVVATSSFAQRSKDQQKERKEMSKMTKSELNQKASKTARKKAKEYKKDGWKVSIGDLPLEKQLDRAYQLEYTLDENLQPRYIFGNAQTVGQTYDAAKMQAIAVAKMHIAESMKTMVKGEIQNLLDNDNLGQEEATSVEKTIGSAQQAIFEKIGRTLTVVSAYRTLKNKNIEVMIRLCYDTKEALKVAKEVLKEKLQEQNEELFKKLENNL